MKRLLERIDGWKTGIGMVAYGLLWIAVNWSPDDGLTWETQWVTVALGLITTWTGLAINHKINKIGGLSR